MTASAAPIRVVLTGATGMVGEGVLLECLDDPAVASVLSVGRRPSPHQHPKLSECLVADFSKLEDIADQLTGYDACFYCAGISSAGMNEADYTRVTYDAALAFAGTLVRHNPEMVFCHVSGNHTDGTEQGRVMWARVKGKTENALLRLPFAHVYNFRPGFMKPSPGQKNVKTLFKMLAFVFPYILPGLSLTMSQVGRSMIHSVTRGAGKPVLEIADMRALAGPK